MIKRLVLVTFVLATVLSMCVVALAKTDDYDLSNTKKIYMVTDDGLVEISKEKYIKQTQEMERQFGIDSRSDFSDKQSKNLSVQPRGYDGGLTDDYYKYKEEKSGQKARRDLREIISNIQKNNTSNKTEFSIKASTTVSYDVSTNLSSEELVAVRANMSIGWSKSKSYEEWHKLTINPGEYGWVEFEPIMAYSKGIVKRFSWLGKEKSSKDVTIYTPIEKNGDCWGYVHLMTDTKKPTE
ncbi:hypothetical protein [Paramaledivibacter caminithermalis]|jgi:hypothetical protein|uniref:SH3 domain-containing protein n=1 Tax=Paramaledivibacter caminithermalis (strain DSM 15212 / CIP 107654 / DViRD3) TaxID=1121301 RepID=A0A1M6M9F4_PARC5|nr:hypothetical protein [Paramaledivibacter caminithermalis]SHJ80069.1 hypothetical protein SAMN02745912_01147 [Paramaledivibacter caminithermalis DSM 15212]